MKHIFLLSIIAFSLSCALSPSQNAGTTAFPFLLETDIGAKSTALGGAWTGWGKSADGFAQNPAAGAMQKGNGIILSYGNFWGLFNHSFAGYYRSLDENNTIAAGIMMVHYGSDFVRTDNEGNELGLFSAGDFGLILSYSRMITKDFSIGISAKPLYSSADTFSSSALCFDAGAMFRIQRDQARIGIAVTNLGTQLSSYGDEKYPLPMGVKFGGSYNLPGFPGTIGAQVETRNDVDFLVKTGMELDFIKPVFLRVGYVMRPKAEEDPSGTEDYNGFTAGVGFDYRLFSFNYSLQHYGILGMVHRFEIAYLGL